MLLKWESLHSPLREATHRPLLTSVACHDPYGPIRKPVPLFVSYYPPFMHSLTGRSYLFQRAILLFIFLFRVPNSWMPSETTLPTVRTSLRGPALLFQAPEHQNFDNPYIKPFKRISKLWRAPPPKSKAWRLE